MPRFRCYSKGVESSHAAREYEADSAAKAAASHAAHVYKTVSDNLGEQTLRVFVLGTGQRLQFKVQAIHTIEFKATLE